MSLFDFERCTPSEFSRILGKWNEWKAALYRSEWEQTRAIMMAVLQPYCKKKLKASDVAVLPWDKKETSVPKGTSSQERMEEIAKRLGVKP